MKYAFALVIWLSTMSLSAQQSFTEKLQQAVESVGKIILHQDKSITDLVNGTRNSAAIPAQRRQANDTTSAHFLDPTDSLSLGPKVRISGYRIQVYFGDNSRKGKTEARAAGLRFRNSFPELPVYVSFVSPHWLCRAGDFRTMEEASEVLRQIHEMGIFREAVIVKSKINVRL